MSSPRTQRQENTSFSIWEVEGAWGQRLSNFFGDDALPGEVNVPRAVWDADWSRYSTAVDQVNPHSSAEMWLPDHDCQGHQGKAPFWNLVSESSVRLTNVPVVRLRERDFCLLHDRAIWEIHGRQLLEQLSHIRTHLFRHTMVLGETMARITCFQGRLELLRRRRTELVLQENSLPCLGELA